MQNNRTNFENDLQRILSDFLRDRDRDHFDRFREPSLTNRFSRPRSRTFPRANVNQNIPSNTNNLSIVLESLNDNMIRYQENLTSYLTLLTELVTNEELYERLNNNRPAQRTSFFSRNRPFTFNTGTTTTTTTDMDTNTDPLIAYGMRLFTSPSENTNLFENVIVHPTPLQIAQSTDLVTYQDTGLFLNRSCPINLEEFRNGEQIRRIIHCGHCFNTSSFDRWFSRNVRCPVCRYDIRDYDSMSDLSNNVTSPIDTGLTATSTFQFPDSPNTNIFEDIINQTRAQLSTVFDGSNNLALRLEIPISYTETYDASNNLISRELN